MSHTPLVSAIIIFLNAGRFLREAIDSVIAQTWRHWELILVDDGSTDGSTAIAREYAAAMPDRILYIDHPGHANRGMSASRNEGLRHSRGEYVAFLDADDVWIPAKLAEQVAVLESHPAVAMTYGRTCIWKSWTGRPEDEDKDRCFPLGVQPDTVVPYPELLPVLVRNKAQTPCTGNAMIRRRAVDLVGGFEEEFPGMYEDQVFFFKIELQCNVYVSGSVWMKYRLHADSCTAKSDYLVSRRRFVFWLERYMLQQQVASDSRVWMAVQRELWPSRHPRLYRAILPFVRAAGRARTFIYPEVEKSRDPYPCCFRCADLPECRTFHPGSNRERSRADVPGLGAAGHR